MPKNLDNWCPEIYRGLFIDRHNDDQIRIAPCCQADSKLTAVQGFSFESNEFLSNLRDRFDQGQFPSECDNCWKVEQHGHKSRRQSAIEFYNLPDQSREIRLESLDHSATWACNLACIMCKPDNSSTWAKELNFDRDTLLSIGRLYQKNNNIIDTLDLSSLKKLHFNGGEPLLNQDQVGLLEKLDSEGVLPYLFISYNTNGTQRPSGKLLDLWQSAHLVKIFFSIDGTGSCFDYVRWPAKWNQVQENILWLKDNLPSNVMFGFNVTVGSYNLLEISDVYDWFLQNLKTNREGDESDFNWQLANNFDPGVLKAEPKHAAISSLTMLHSLSDYVKSTLSNTVDDRWIEKLNDIDRSRGTDWKSSLRVSQYY